MTRSVIHHYVPQWYQKRFLQKGESEFTVRDLQPFVIDKSGRKFKCKEFYTKGPKKLFQMKDLYSIYYNGEMNDAIESMLFGEIDKNACEAISYLVNQNWNELHNKFSSLFDFICIQKYRTPRGIDLLRKMFPNFSRNEIMGHLIKTKQSFGAMMAESFWEIVESPDHNFIISDNPATLYNRKIYPGHIENRYPYYPDFKRVGTQIIFPLDNAFCLIISHKDLIRQPNIDSLKIRINAREYGNSMFMYGDFLLRPRRMLTTIESEYINQIIIESATRYIASSNADNLLNKKRPDWQKVGQSLIPDGKHKAILGIDGKMFIGGGNNELFYAQDEYGRDQYRNPKWSGR